MKIKNKFLKILIWTASSLAVLVAVIAIAGYSYLKFFLLPKINKNSDLSSDKISVSDIAKDFSDKQIIDNIINFDKSSASDMLSVINEIDDENSSEKTDASSGNNTQNTDKSNTETGTVTKEVTKENTTAYQRIMNEASKDEVSEGLSIMSKISMSKVNELRKSGDTAALKAYIRSVLSPSEISEALKLYNKYKHLL